jgi:hypothetical protein
MDLLGGMRGILWILLGGTALFAVSLTWLRRSVEDRRWSPAKEGRGRRAAQGSGGLHRRCEQMILWGGILFDCSEEFGSIAGGNLRRNGLEHLSLHKYLSWYLSIPSAFLLKSSGCLHFIFPYVQFISDHSLNVNCDLCRPLAHQLPVSPLLNKDT